MAVDNTITVSGNLTRDPEIGYTTGNAAKARLGLAVNRRWKTPGNDEWQEETSFFNVTCWRELAENVAATLVKGSRVIVTGRLEQRTWETDDGEKKNIFEIAADDIGPSLRWATATVIRNPKSGGPVIPRSTVEKVADVEPDAFGSEPF